MTAPTGRPAAGLDARSIRFVLTLTCVGAISGVLPGQTVATDATRRLQERLRKFPEADANRDGILTEEEARAHQRGRKEGKVAAAPKGENAVTPTPTIANASYGPHPRNVLDFWRAPAVGPTPVLVFFHGGSFKAGDKANVLARPIFAEGLKAGISVVSVNYRFSTDAPFPAPMHDGARAVQFVRAQAQEWKIDPARIAVSGSSAGATLALWIALHDDLADPASQDVVARQSTRVVCASPHNGTAGLDPDYFKQHAGVTRLGAAIYQLFGTTAEAGLATPEKRALVREAAPLTHASPNDPPLFLTYAGDPAEAPFKADAPQNAWIHHVSLGVPLKERFAELGIACEFYYKSKPPAPGAEIAFLKKHLFR